MKSPKCRTCGKEHALGGCPEFKNRSHAVGPAMGAKGGAVLSGGDNQRDEAGATPAKLQVATDTIVVGVDPASKDFGAKVIGRVMEDGRIEILRLTHSKAQFNKAEYQRQYMADQRTIKRLGLNCTVSEYRKAKEK